MMIRLERYLRSVFECIASISQLLKKNLYDAGPMQDYIGRGEMSGVEYGNCSSCLGSKPPAWSYRGVIRK
jgi:hypothetical protein